MAYCRKCGKEIDNEAVICPFCGVQQKSNISAPVEDNGGFGWGLLGFCVPVVGLILYLVWKDERPLTSRAAGKGALISVILGVVIWIIYFVVIVGLLAGGAAGGFGY